MIWAPYPHRAGFCITDDTDAATLEGVRAVYDFLASIGLRTTKTVWALEPAEPCGIPALPPSILRGITLEDPRYLEYCLSLRERGVEICLHGASAGNNVRERTVRALETLERRFGLPGTYVCHAKNAENLYWHEKVAPRGPARWLLAPASRYRCSGEDPASRYFWGDVCLEKVRHLRLFRTRNVNTLAENPSMPYFDPQKPLVASWFAATKRSFRDAASPAALERLVRECGLCVLYQYMHRYADPATGRVREEFREAAERLMATDGVWVDTTSVLMERLRLIQGIFVAHRGGDVWIANTNPTDVTELQLEIGPGGPGAGAPSLVTANRADAARDPGAANPEWHGRLLRIRRIPAGRLLRLGLADPPTIGADRAIPLDRSGRGRRSFRFGAVLVNAGPDLWETGVGEPLASRTCRVVAAPGMGAPRPFSVASPGELYRLLAGQLAIIGREILLKGRSLDSQKFLGAAEIALEDHSNW